MFGRFLELSLATGDIAASVLFYEQLGFRPLPCTDAWPYPYCALSDGRLCLGLHQRADAGNALSFVHPGIARDATTLEDSGYVVAHSHLGFEDFNELQLRGPDGLDVRLLEARTCSPDSEAYRESLCGYFAALGIPSSNVDAASHFWQGSGFIAHEAEALPFPHQPLCSNHLNLWLHALQPLALPTLIFMAAEMRERIARLRAANVAMASRLPLALDPQANALLQAPEGTRLLLLQGDA
jgi:hypothetical protein